MCGEARASAGLELIGDGEGEVALVLVGALAEPDVLGLGRLQNEAVAAVQVGGAL